MSKRIFIGSSSTSLNIAADIQKELKNLDGITPVLWPEIFPSGTITFEGIERESRKLSGAILVASPDDKTTIEEKEVKTARGNVILEIGYLSAIMGRSRTMIAKFKETKLPSDLNGVTYLPLGEYPGDNGNIEIKIEERKKLTEWAASLPLLQKGFSYTTLLHGYTGRWELNLVFSRWRGYQIPDDEYVEIRGMLMDIHLPTTGHGHGVMQGELLVSVKNCYVKFHVVDSIRNVEVLSDGALKFTSRTFARQNVEEQGDIPKFMDGMENKLKGVTDFSWVLHPSKGDVKRLKGEYITHSNGNVHSQASVEAILIETSS